MLAICKNGIIMIHDNRVWRYGGGVILVTYLFSCTHGVIFGIKKNMLPINKKRSSSVTHLYPPLSIFFNLASKAASFALFCFHLSFTFLRHVPTVGFSISSGENNLCSAAAHYAEAR